jgi:FkbM family methyltransferase
MARWPGSVHGAAEVLEPAAFLTSPVRMTNTTGSKPFGAFPPTAFQSMLIAMGHGMPANWAGRRGASLIRSVLKRWSDAPIDAVRLGSRMRLYANGNASEKRLMTSPQFFDPGELAVLERALKPDFVFVDIGSNAGAYTLFVASRVGARGRIVAVDPHPVARQRLQCNLDLNGIGWVTIAPVALSDTTGTLSLFINDRNIGSSSLSADVEAGSPQRAIEVPTRTLLSLVEEEGLSRIDAIKIDVEGVEDRILAPFFGSAPSALWPDLLLMEDNKSAWNSDLLALLRQSGYAIVLETGGNIVMRR